MGGSDIRSMSSIRPICKCRCPPLLFWRRNPTKTLGFLLPWISPWFFVGFLLSPLPNAQSFLRFFSLGFLNPRNSLAFLELFTC